MWLKSIKLCVLCAYVVKKTKFKQLITHELIPARKTKKYIVYFCRGI